MHLTPSGSLNRPVTVPSCRMVKTSPRWLPTQQRSPSMKIPNAGAPLANRHRTGAWRAVERVLTTGRRVTGRACRWPRTAGAYPLRTFSPTFRAAAAIAFASVANSVVLACPGVPIRP